MDFPTFAPSSRVYTHGEWPVSRHKFMTGRSQQMLHANGKGKQRLRLRYDNALLKNLDYFIAHFNRQRGTHTGFYLTAKVMYAGWDGIKGTNNDNRRFGFGLKWRYSKPPRIRSQRGKYGTIEIELETVAAVDTFYKPPGVPEDCLPCLPPIDPRPVPIPSPEPAPELKESTCGWTCVRVRMVDGAENINFHDAASSSSPYSPNYVKNNPEKWLLGELPLTYREETIDGVTYKWAQQYFSYQLIPDYLMSNCYNQSGSSPAQFIEPCPTNVVNGRYGRDDPRSEFNTSAIRHTVLIKNFNHGFSDQLWPVYYYQPEPPWLAPPQIQVSNGYPTNRVFSAFAKDRSYSNNTIQGHMYMPGFRYQVWIPDIADRINGSPTVIDENGDRQWSDKGRWVDVDENWNGGVWNGRKPECTDPTQTRKLPPKEAFCNTRTDQRDLEPRVTNSVLDSNYFPNISPSRRRIVFGDYEVDRYGSDQEVTMPLPSTAQKNDVVMQLVYANRRDEIARMFMDHYDQCSGEFYDFPIAPVDKKEGTFAGWDDPDTKNIRQGRWIYTRPPRIEQTAIGHSTTTIEILNLSPALMDPDAGSGSGSSDGTFGGGSGSSGQGPAVPPTPNPGPGDPALLRKR